MAVPSRAKSTLEQWRIFQAVVEFGGYAQAAAQLNKSQSSLNHAVSKLQSLLGVQLLEVKGRKAHLTPSGEVMLRRSRLLTQNIEELEQLANNLEQGWEPQISIAVDVVQNKAPLLKALRAFLGESCGTRVELIDTVISGTEEAIIEQQTDMVICANLPKGVLGEKLTTINMLPLVHKQHPLAKIAQAVAIDEVTQQLQLVVRDTGSNRREDRGWLKAEQRWTFSSFTDVLAVLNQGIGFAWVPEHLALAHLDDNLVELNIAGGARKTLVSYLVVPNQQAMGPAARLLHNLILKHARSS